MKYAVRLSRKRLENLGWPSYWTQYAQSAFSFAEDPICPLCGEEYDTSLHLLGRCNALVQKQRKQFGKHLLFSSEIRQEHWSSLLKSAKNSKMFQ